MPKILFEGQEYQSKDNESVLDCLLRHGVSVHYSCHVGICQSCMMRMLQPAPPPESQNGLKETYKQQNYFLMCSCIPQQDIEIARPGDDYQNVDAEVLALDKLNQDVMRVRLRRPEDYTYYPGQFLNLENPDGIERSYSLASLPQDPFLELHIRLVPGGKVSGWVFEKLQVGDKVSISPAAGDCFYTAGQETQNILLIGTGTGLAPLYGILRDALRQGHRGEMHLYHGSKSVDGLYLTDELRQLTSEHASVHYHPCVSRGVPPAGITAGRANDRALQEIDKLDGWRVFVCGQPDMVKDTQKRAFLAGASMKDICADPFVPSDV